LKSETFLDALDVTIMQRLGFLLRAFYVTLTKESIRTQID
jgi:hypothetical protein